MAFFYLPERKSDGETDNLTEHLYGYTFIYERVNGIGKKLCKNPVRQFKSVYIININSIQINL